MLKLQEPSFGKEEILEVLDSFLSGNISMGEKNKKFEEKWVEWLGSKYTSSCNSGSSANLLIFSALKSHLFNHRLKDGDEVIVSPVSWSTSYFPIIQSNLKCNLVDVDLNTFNIDVDKIEENINEKTKVIMIVHLVGSPCNMDKILELCNKYNLILIEDCCESYGALWDEKKIGTFGLASSFSFMFAHHMSCSPDTPIPYIDGNNSFKIDSIEDIYKKYLNKVENIKLISFNDNNKLYYSRPNKIIKHALNKKTILRIVLENNREIDVTEDHSLFVWDNNKQDIFPIQCSSLTENSLIAIPKFLPQINIKKKLDFLSFCKNDIVHTYFISGEIKENINNIKCHWKSKLAKRKSNYIMRNRIPLKYVTLFNKTNKIGIKSQREKKYIKLNYKIDKDLSRLLGFYIAEGCYQTHGIVFSFHLKEKEYIKDVCNIMKNIFGIDGKIISKIDTNSSVIIFNSLILKIFFKDFLKIKSGAKNKRIPSIIWTTSKENQISFLYGYFCGDGHLSDNRIYVDSSSKKLINDVSYLCSMLNLKGSIYRDDGCKKKIINKEITKSGILYRFNLYNISFIKNGTIRILKENRHKRFKYSNKNFSAKDIKETFNIKLFNKKLNRLVSYRFKDIIIKFPDLIKKIYGFSKLKDGDLTLLKIKKIERIIPEYTHVFDFCVPRSENFIGGWQPVCLHNSTAEGGMASTNDEIFNDIIKIKRAHGWIRDILSESMKEKFISMNPNIDKKFLFVDTGYNLRMNDMQASMGIHQIKKIDKFIEIRRKNHFYLCKRIKEEGIDKYISILQEREKQFLSPFAFPIIAKTVNIKNKLIKIFKENKIETRGIAAGNIIKQPFIKNYSDFFIYKDLSNADTIHNNGFWVGNHQGINIDDYEKVIQLMMDALK
jgi:dTDP-4-amino-4,6-dideoxygalactose transaminase